MELEDIHYLHTNHMRQFIVLRKTEDNPCDEANDLGIQGVSINIQWFSNAEQLIYIYKLNCQIVNIYIFIFPEKP